MGKTSSQSREITRDFEMRTITSDDDTKTNNQGKIHLLNSNYLLN